MINVFQPSLGSEELEAVRKVFESNWIGKGKKVEEFEQALATRFGIPDTQFHKGAGHVVTTTSCTQGLFLLGSRLGWKPGDEVVLPSISFVGAANAVAAHGARPVFADVDPTTLNMRLKDLERVFSAKTKAVIPLHYGGWPNREIGHIREYCDGWGDIHVIEDVACSPFSAIGGKPCGTFGHFGVWSFDAMKILCAGDGGAVVCEDYETACKLRADAYLGGLRSSGDKQEYRWWEVETDGISGRHIMNDITASIAIEQLKKVDAFIGRRREIHARYDEAFRELAWLTTPQRDDHLVRSSYYLYWIQLRINEERDQLAYYLRDRGVYTTFRYWPLHEVAGYGHNRRESCPIAADLAEKTLNLPLHQGLSDDDVQQVIDAVKSFRL